jgi:alkaline phosphatase D
MTHRTTLSILMFSLHCVAAFAQRTSPFIVAPCHTVNTTIKADTITRIAFGSCAKQSKSMPVLLAAKEAKPDVFIWLGDNIYGDTDDMGVMRAKYAELSCRPEFKALNTTVPFLATWDDHDYGQDDMGKEYRFKAESKVEFMQFWNEPKDSERFRHDGIYHAFTVGPMGRRVQFILLDTRTFRDGILPAQGRGTKHDYRPHTDTLPTMLGEAQWAWLRTVLLEPADLRIIATSNQFGISYNGYEAWANFPHEQLRMARLVKETRANGVVFISGDVHWAEISKLEVEGCYPLYDITSSGITQTWPTLEPNTNRVGRAFKPNNFGMIEVDWNADNPHMHFRIHNRKGRVVRGQKVRFEELKF